MMSFYKGFTTGVSDISHLVLRLCACNHDKENNKSERFVGFLGRIRDLHLATVISD